MLIPKKFESIVKSELDLTAANFPSQTKRITIPSNAPIEEIWVVFQVTLASAIADWRAYGLISALKRVTLNVNPGSAFDAVYASGPSLIFLADNEGTGLDASTRAAVFAGNAGHVTLASPIPTPSGSKLRVCYRIPMVHPGLTGPLRLRSLLDVINHRQDAILTLDFAPAADFTATADPFSAASVEVVVMRRDMPADINNRILASGGYLKQDIRESSFDVPASLTNSERRFAIPSPGDYTTLVMSMLAGTAASVLTPTDISGNVTVNQETLWRLESGGNALQTWRMKELQILNQLSKVCQPVAQLPTIGTFTTINNVGVTTGAPPVWVTAKATAGHPNCGGIVVPGTTSPYAGLCIQDPSIVALDFLTDGITDAGEFGSLLNANFQSDAIKWEIVGNVTTPASIPSNVSIVGRRYRDSVEAYKKLAA